MTVTSGKCVPPLYGSFNTYTSPGFIFPAFFAITVLMLSPMEPRCTGMWGALAMRLPSASKSAQEKSRRSLMFTEYAVCARRTPICSAIDMKRLLKTSSITGSARVPSANVDLRGVAAAGARHRNLRHRAGRRLDSRRHGNDALERIRLRDRFHRRRLDDELAIGHEEAEPSAIQPLEILAHRLRRTERNR